ncbi:MAG: hypothetical protein Q8O31_06405 [Rhodocyclaceae bacterium]|nr:hypothetical protein [Rhodocyclaceae bacterium]
MSVFHVQVYPWHEEHWTRLWQASMPHAILIVGPSGIGKRAFALALAKRLLCESPPGELACDACPSCRWFLGGIHPDFRWVFSEAETEAEADS